MKPITVLLADDHTILREGLRALLKTENDMIVVGGARQGFEALELAIKYKPDVIVMDIAMPLLNGLGATQRILEVLPDTRVLMLSAHSDDPYIDRALQVGAAGFLIKQTSAECLSTAIREVNKGKTYFSAGIAKRVEQRNSERSKIKNESVKGLTAREREVIQLIAEGAANKQVAAYFGISIKTVGKHRQHLMDKLNIHDTAGLTRYAIAHGIIECSVQVTII